MNWHWRIVVIVPAASKALAEHAARGINSTGSEYEGDAFTSALSANGGKPATHWGLYTSATDAMIENMAAVLPMIEAQYWRHNIDGQLVSSNVTESAAQAWGWTESLDAAGLQPVLKPSEF